jgi:hypothetical protein
MPDPVTGLVVGGSSLLSGAVQSRAAGKAAGQQADAAQAGIEEQRRQFEEMQKLLAPYVQAGQPALQAQQAMLGLGGAEAQQQAIAGVEQSPLLQALMRQGEEAMLQQASATGGLRGGNMQAALAQFRPQMLQEALDQQYARLGGLTALGQQSAAGVGTAGMQTGQAVAGLLQQQGAARAGGALGRAAPFASLLQMPAQMYGMGVGMGRIPFPSFGGAQAAFSQTGLGSSGFGTGLAYGNQDIGQFVSDRRLKTDITRLSTRSDGLGVYQFRYVWGGPLHIGLMAQEVQPLYPDAVLQRDGYLMVDYGRVPGG